MVNIDENLFISQGMGRKCYAHPSNANLCIKIPTPRGERSANRERRYFKRLHLCGKNMGMISDYKTSIKTNIGKGDVFELIRDSDGSISKSLKHYLRLNDENINRQIIEQIEALRVYLTNEYILFSDLGSENILLQKDNDNSLKLMVIDGIGDNNQVLLLEFIKPLGLKRSAKKWEHFRTELIPLSPSVAKNIKPFV